MRRSIFGPFRDLIRFYEGLTIFGFHEELAASCRAPMPAPAGSDPSRRRVESQSPTRRRGV